MTRHLVRSPALLERWTRGEGLLVQHIGLDLPDGIRDAAWKGRLVLPGFRADLAAFVEAAGGPPGLRRIEAALAKVGNARRSLREAERELEVVRAVSWEADLSKFDMFHLSRGSEEFASNPEEAYEDLGWEEYEGIDPRPRGVSFDAPEAVARQDRYAAWVRAEAPPFAFGTRPVTWPGIGAADIRSALADDDEVDVESLVECSLDDHHEDAFDSVVDLEGLVALVERCKPHAGTGSAEDLALEAGVAAWNARQDVVSYWADEAVAVPVFADATHEEAIAWCERLVAAARARLAAAEDGWEPAPLEAPEAALAP